MIFQEPMVALNPLMTVGRQTDEIIEVHTRMRPARASQAHHRGVQRRAPARARAYSRKLSARAFGRPAPAGNDRHGAGAGTRAIIADEPTTALDVTTQAQILRLLKELQGRHGTAILFITHDFGVVAEIADRVAVMRQGKLVEQGPASDVLLRPQHEYTRALVGAVPSLTPRRVAQRWARPVRRALAPVGVGRREDLSRPRRGIFPRPAPGIGRCRREPRDRQRALTGTGRRVRVPANPRSRAALWGWSGQIAERSCSRGLTSPVCRGPNCAPIARRCR